MPRANVSEFDRAVLNSEELDLPDPTIDPEDDEDEDGTEFDDLD